MDCYFIEKGSSKSNYTSGTNLTLSDGVFRFERTSSSNYFYLDIPKTDFPIADFVGKHLTVALDCIELNAPSLILTLYDYDGTSWGNSQSVNISSVGTLTTGITVRSNAEQVRIRIDINSSGSIGDNATFKDFRLVLD